MKTSISLWSYGARYCIICGGKEEVMDIVDSLSIGVDISKDGNALVVMRQRGKDEIDLINVVKGEEVIEIYNKLIGKNT